MRVLVVAIDAFPSIILASVLQGESVASFNPTLPPPVLKKIMPTTREDVFNPERPLVATDHLGKLFFLLLYPHRSWLYLGLRLETS